MTVFHDLESPIINTALAAQVLASIFEDVNFEAANKGQGIRLTDHEAEMLAFLIYDLCARTKALRKDFDAALEADMANENPATAQRNAA